MDMAKPVAWTMKMDPTVWNRAAWSADDDTIHNNYRHQFTFVMISTGKGRCTGLTGILFTANDPSTLATKVSVCKWLIIQAHMPVPIQHSLNEVLTLIKALIDFKDTLTLTAIFK
jgi:hypothetical protein